MRKLIRLLLVAAVPAVLPAQQSTTFTLRLRAVDSAGVAVANVDVTVVRGLQDVVAHTTTSASGDAVLSFKRGDGDHEVTARKLGFLRTDRFFSIRNSDSLRLTLVLQRAATTLAPVTITAAEDLKRKSYHLDADDLLNSRRPVIDGTDIFKLRPDMMNSRGGPKACEVQYTPRDGWVETVWVNGKRVVLATVDPLAVARRTAFGLKPHEPPSKRAIARGANPDSFAHIDTVMSILRSIHPEHIAEVTYHDCFDTSVGKVGSDMAMFIVLKPGIGFREGIGSYVIGDKVVATETTPASPANPSAPGESLRIGDLPRYRFRVLGVFDEATGEPIEGLEVVDSLSGLRGRTTVTGTVSLYFVSEGESPVQLRAAGYRDTTILVRISPRDTVPITLVLAKKAPPPGPWLAPPRGAFSLIPGNVVPARPRMGRGRALEGWPSG